MDLIPARLIGNQCEKAQHLSWAFFDRFTALPPPDYR
jgi:hypothetical protein